MTTPTVAMTPLVKAASFNCVGSDPPDCVDVTVGIDCLRRDGDDWDDDDGDDCGDDDFCYCHEIPYEVFKPGWGYQQRCKGKCATAEKKHGPCAMGNSAYGNCPKGQWCEQKRGFYGQEFILTPPPHADFWWGNGQCQ